MSPENVSDFNVALLVEQPESSKSLSVLTAHSDSPTFIFRQLDDSTIATLKFIDRLLYADADLKINPDNFWVKILMGRRGHAPLKRIDLAINEVIGVHLACDCTRQQLSALLKMRRKPYSFVIGPPGTGKTWLAATHALTLALSGKRVMIVAQSSNAVAEILTKCVELCRAQGLNSFAETILWNVASSSVLKDEAYKW
jgi:hypothetical protein